MDGRGHWAGERGHQPAVGTAEAIALGATGDDDAAAGAAENARPYSVRVLDGSGHAVRRQVWIGISNRVSAEVLDGLAPGDVVVIGRHTADATGDAGSASRRTGVGRLF